jgi:RimJ/RimL family protein N-acetyltransferase
MRYSDLYFRKAQLSDISSIRDLAEKSWWHHYPTIISEEQIRYMLRLMYDEAALREQLEKGQDFYLFGKEGNDPEGFISLSILDEQEAFLHKFYISPDAQGKGLGAAAFDRLLKENANINCIRLTVNRQNFKSINFYFKLGFHIERVADFEIGNDFVMNDFVMKWTSN